MTGPLSFNQPPTINFTGTQGWGVDLGKLGKLGRQPWEGLMSLIRC